MNDWNNEEGDLTSRAFLQNTSQVASHSRNNSKDELFAKIQKSPEASPTSTENSRNRRQSILSYQPAFENKKQPIRQKKSEKDILSYSFKYIKEFNHDFQNPNTNLSPIKEEESENEEFKAPSLSNLYPAAIFDEPKNKTLSDIINKQQISLMQSKTMISNNCTMDNTQITKKEPPIHESYNRLDLLNPMCTLGSGSPNTHKNKPPQYNSENKRKDNFNEEYDSIDHHIRLRQQYDIKKLIILPDDPFKFKWDFIITTTLVFTAFVTPYAIAFFDTDSTGWTIVDFIVIFIFGLDMFLNFFTAYYDEDDNLIMDRKRISFKYLKSWFMIDLIASIPISFILNQQDDMSNISRLAKLPRLYRLLKMSKLVRMLKIVKERNKFTRYLNKIFKISAGLERLLYFTFIFCLMCHISACMWFFMAKMDDLEPNCWVVRGGYLDDANVDIYVASLYFTITTITTVGYGDITSGTTIERITSIIIMCIGVCSYSFAIGSLSSVLSSLDSKQAKLVEKLNTLDDLKRDYNLSPEFYIRLRKVLKYDHSRDETEKLKFVKELPQNLQVELAVLMHRKIIQKIPFFQNKDKNVIAFIGPMLRPLKVFKGLYIYTEEQSIDAIYFLVKGRAAFVLLDNSDLPYVSIDEGYYFGDVDILNSENEKRLFTVRAMKDCELLALYKNDIQSINEEYPELLKELFQQSSKRLDQIFELRNKAIKFTKERKNTHFKRSTTYYAPFHKALAEIDEQEEESLDNSLSCKKTEKEDIDELSENKSASRNKKPSEFSIVVNQSQPSPSNTDKQENEEDIPTPLSLQKRKSRFLEKNLGRKGSVLVQIRRSVLPDGEKKLDPVEKSEQMDNMDNQSFTNLIQKNPKLLSQCKRFLSHKLVDEAFSKQKSSENQPKTFSKSSTEIVEANRKSIAQKISSTKSTSQFSSMKNLFDKQYEPLSEGYLSNETDQENTNKTENKDTNKSDSLSKSQPISLKSQLPTEFDLDKMLNEESEGNQYHQPFLESFDKSQDASDCFKGADFSQLKGIYKT